MALYAFDGTWNDSRAPDEERDLKKDTNVHRFRQLYDGDKVYSDGVGSRGGTIGKLIGGFTGAGAQKRIEELFRALKANFDKGDTCIDIVGYSRGAAIARMFVLRIDRDFDSLAINGKPLSKPPAVRFLGLFDTVASFGIPWDANEHAFLADIPEFVENTFHAMALDETRETFGIERCYGNRRKITEVWFRGSHADIGGNATYMNRKEENSNRERSDIALNWILSKANACGLPVPPKAPSEMPSTHDDSIWTDAPVTVQNDLLKIGNVGTLSRRIHLGDLVHHTLERTDLTKGINGQLLRRIDVPTRIEDAELQRSCEAMVWVPPRVSVVEAANATFETAKPSVVELSSRRYPFDVLPARTWKSWFTMWKIDLNIREERLLDFWAPCEADRALAWDIYVELQTRITTQKLDDDTGNDLSALTSVYQLFPLSREFMHQHGVQCANAGMLLTEFLNQHIRGFTAKWHKKSVEQKWEKNPGPPQPEFRAELKSLQPVLVDLAHALSKLADAEL